MIDCGFCLEQDEALSYDTRAPRRNAATLSALEAADVVLVVGAGDPVGIQRLVRGLGELTDLGLGSTRFVLVNRVRASVAGPHPGEAVGQALARYAGVTDAHLVPDDRPALDTALLEARTLREAAPGSPARRALAGVAARVDALLVAAPVEEPAGAGRARLSRRARADAAHWARAHLPPRLARRARSRVATADGPSRPRGDARRCGRCSPTRTTKAWSTPRSWRRPTTRWRSWASGRGAPQLRCIVSADVADAAIVPVSDDDDVPSAVELTRAVPQADVICVHVDEPAAAADVTLAAGGDEEAAARLDERDLLWYDASELGSVPR